MTHSAITRSGPIIAHLGDTPIYEWLEDQKGQHYGYVGLYDIEKEHIPERLIDGDLVMAPGLIYRKTVLEGKS